MRKTVEYWNWSVSAGAGSYPAEPRRWIRNSNRVPRASTEPVLGIARSPIRLGESLGILGHGPLADNLDHQVRAPLQLDETVGVS